METQNKYNPLDWLNKLPKIGNLKQEEREKLLTLRKEVDDHERKTMEGASTFFIRQDRMGDLDTYEELLTRAGARIVTVDPIRRFFEE